MEPGKSTFYKSLRSAFNIVGCLFAFFLFAHIGLKIAIKNCTDPHRISVLETLANDIVIISSYSFEFVQPFLQLIIIMIMVDWFARRFGFNFSIDKLKFQWNPQTIIVLIAVTGFSVAVAYEIESAKMLKELALIAIGFYFGRQNKVTSSSPQSALEERETSKHES